MLLKKPIFGYGNRWNDYGLAFYCSDELKTAKEWAVVEEIDGYANKYELNLEGLKILNLSDSKYNILHWITILIENRVFNLKYDITKASKEYLINNFSLPLNDYVIIIGYRANDLYFFLCRSIFKQHNFLPMIVRNIKIRKLRDTNSN